MMGDRVWGAQPPDSCGGGSAAVAPSATERARERARARAKNRSASKCETGRLVRMVWVLGRWEVRRDWAVIVHRIEHALMGGTSG